MQNKNQITLLMPDLFPLLKFGGAASDLPNLAWVFSKAGSKTLPKARNALDYLADCCGLANSEYQSEAALHQHGAGDEVRSWVCYASPVLMRPNRDHLAIEQAAGFELDADEGEALCAEFNQHFEENGFSFSYRDPGVVFCQSSEIIDVANCAPSKIIGRNVLNHLPSGKGEMTLRSLFNESQMLLHHSATNRRRMEQGKLEINSLWFWGGGHLPAAYSSPYKRILTNAPEVTGFAKLGQSDTRRLPAALSPELFFDKGKHLIYLDFQQDADIALLAEKYAEACVQLLKNKTINELSVLPDHGKLFTVTANSLKKFWKPRQSIQAFF